MSSRRNRSRRRRTWTICEIIFSHNFEQKWYFSARLGLQLSFDMYYAVNHLKSKKVEIEIRNEFSNVWGNTNTIAIPIYRVLPCPMIE